MTKYTISEIVKQLESCNYKCEAGMLEANVAFVRLKEIGNSRYQTERYIGEKIYTETGELVSVIALTGKYASRIGGYIATTVCKNIYQNHTSIKFKELLTPKEQKEKEVKAALETLKKHGYSPISIEMK